MQKVLFVTVSLPGITRFFAEPAPDVLAGTVAFELPSLELQLAPSTFQLDLKLTGFGKLNLDVSLLKLVKLLTQSAAVSGDPDATSRGSARFSELDQSESLSRVPLPFHP